MIPKLNLKTISYMVKIKVGRNQSQKYKVARERDAHTTQQIKLDTLLKLFG